MSCVSNNNYGYINIKTTYREKPKDRNIEREWMIYKPTERVDSIRKDKVETRLKWKWNVWYEFHHAAAYLKTWQYIWKMWSHVWAINSNVLTSHEKRLKMKFQSWHCCISLFDVDVTTSKRVWYVWHGIKLWNKVLITLLKKINSVKNELRF